MKVLLIVLVLVLFNGFFALSELAVLTSRRARLKQMATESRGARHALELADHPEATRAYAWSSPIEGSDKRRFLAVLHQPPVTSPVEAVRAAIVVERRSSK